MTARRSANSADSGPAATSWPPGVIEPGALYVVEEATRRLRWKRHARAQALRLGLRTVKSGSRLYVCGEWLLDFFERLAARQSENTEGQRQEH